MSKTLTEMAAEILAARVRHEAMTSKEIENCLNDTFVALEKLKEKENIILGNAVQDPIKEPVPAQAKTEAEPEQEETTIQESIEKPEQSLVKTESDESPDEKLIETPTEKAEELEPEESAVQEPVDEPEQPAQEKTEPEPEETTAQESIEEPEQPLVKTESDESPDEKLIETPTEKAEELEPEESAVQEPVDESEKPAIEPKKETITGTILNLIKSKPKGVDTKYIMEQTGFKKNQVWATVNKAKNKGQVKTTKRGIYVSVKSRKGKQAFNLWGGPF